MTEPETCSECLLLCEASPRQDRTRVRAVRCGCQSNSDCQTTDDRIVRRIGDDVYNASALSLRTRFIDTCNNATGTCEGDLIIVPPGLVLAMAVIPLSLVFLSTFALCMLLCSCDIGKPFQPERSDVDRYVFEFKERCCSLPFDEVDPLPGRSIFTTVHAKYVLTTLRRYHIVALASSIALLLMEFFAAIAGAMMFVIATAYEGGLGATLLAERVAREVNFPLFGVWMSIWLCAAVAWTASQHYLYYFFCS